MNQNKSNYITVKWIVSIIFSVVVGTFITNILGNVGLNVWITRVIGAFVTAIVELIFYYLWIKKEEK